MKHLVLFSAGMLFTINSLANDKKISQQEYISMWKDVAIIQMEEFQIPASITLAQGILESANGNSDLAQKANNHFGIKCGNWQGAAFYKDDNSKGECFRKYKDAKDSYLDHSNFLKNKDRYAFLFRLDKTDYKSWANGLQKAGYATNPKYASLLIELIERLKLDQFDGESVSSAGFKQKASVGNTLVKGTTARKVLTHQNNIHYVIAGKGDTYYRLSKELNVSLWQLYKYNEFGAKKDCLSEGDLVFLEPKKRKSSVKKALVLTKEASLREVSQTEGVKVKRLLKFNEMDSADEIIPKGTKIYLK